jgi:hypothetical protein
MTFLILHIIRMLHLYALWMISLTGLKPNVAMRRAPRGAMRLARWHEAPESIPQLGISELFIPREFLSGNGNYLSRRTIKVQCVYVSDDLAEHINLPFSSQSL